MNISVAGKNIAAVSGSGVILTDAQSALDLMATVWHETGCNRIVIDKAAITPDFFKLSTGLAGEILQKYVNYHVKLAITGDFSCYTSKPLHDFIYECNNGDSIFFVSTLEQAVERLGS